MRQLAKYCDIATLLIGAGLFMSPWVLAFGAPETNLPTQSAGLLGAVIGVSSLAALTAFEVWELYIVAVCAVAAIASPWVLGFGGYAAVFAHVLAGIFALAFAATHLFVVRREAKPVPTTRALPETLPTQKQPGTGRSRPNRRQAGRRRSDLSLKAMRS